MDKKFKILGILHLADIFWLALVVVLVFAAVQFSVPRQVAARPGAVPVRFTIELGEQRTSGEPRLIEAGFHERIRTGEPLFDSLRGLHIGTIVDVYARPFQVAAFDEDAGMLRRAPVEGLEYVYIVVEAHAQVCDYETLIGLYPIAVGREAMVRSRDFAGQGFIIALEHLP